MDAVRRKRLEAAGWMVGSVEELLALSRAELAEIDKRWAAERESDSGRLRSGG